MPKPLYPSLYQVNTRVWLTELSRALGRPATLWTTCRTLSWTSARYDRDGSELGSRGLFLDLPPWGHHVFDVSIV
jgi:hypothetical protein